MRKRLLTSMMAIGLVACLSFTGCTKKTKSTEGKMKTLAEYKGLECSQSNTVATEDEITSFLDSAAEQHVTTEKKESGKVKDGETVNIDYVGTIDGVEFDGGSAEGYDLEIGSGSFVDDFEEQLVGVKVGKTVTVEVTFPDDYSNTDIASKDASFEVTVNYRTIKKTPKVNDEFVTTYYPYVGSTLEEFKEYAKERIVRNKIIGEVWADYVDSCKVATYDSEDLADMKEQVDSYQQYLLYYQYSTDLDTYLEAMGMSKDEWDKKITNLAKDTLKEKMVLEAIAKKEKIKLTDKSYKEDAAILATESTYESIDEMESNLGEENVKYSILSQKVYQVIVDNIVVVADEAESTAASQEAGEQDSTEAE